MEHLQHEIHELKQQLLRMASHAESAVQKAMSALERRDYELALQVITEDEILDHFEMAVDDAAIRLLAKAPLAGDLRLITVAMKISQNLERIGDEATKIAKRGRDLAQVMPIKVTIPLPDMSSLALSMLKSALDAFVSADPAKARSLIARDKEVDALNKQAHQELAHFMAEQPGAIGSGLHLMVAAKSLERIADHAKNIAENVVYLYEAEDIRHRTPAI